MNGRDATPVGRATLPFESRSRHRPRGVPLPQPAILALSLLALCLLGIGSIAASVAVADEPRDETGIPRNTKPAVPPGLSPPAPLKLPNADDPATKKDSSPKEPTTLLPALNVRKPNASELARIRQFLTQLEDDRFAVREKATSELIAFDAVAIGVLAEALTGESLEVRNRVLRVLETMYRHGSDEACEEVDRLFTRLINSPQPSIARRAELLLESQASERQERAISKIEKLGGVVRRLDTSNGPVFGPNGEVTIREVLLDADWKGGDAGLEYIHRLTRVPVLMVIDGTPITEEGLTRLQQALPNINLQRRGAAMLGVAGMTTDRGVEIALVKEGSAANKAGVLIGDLVVRYDGQEVKMPEHLIEITRKHKPGDTIPLIVERDGKSVKLEIKLESWRG